MIEKEVHDFGRSIGIENLRLRTGRVLAVGLARTGVVYFEHIGEHLLMYALKNYPFASFAIFYEALKACHSQEMYPFLVRPVFSETKGLGFLVKQHESACTLSSIVTAVTIMQQLHDKLGALKS